jgi:hypothetical protein
MKVVPYIPFLQNGSIQSPPVNIPSSIPIPIGCYFLLPFFLASLFLLANTLCPSSFILTYSTYLIPFYTNHFSHFASLDQLFLT